MNPMKNLVINKVTVNMGVGEGGEKLEKGENLLNQLTGQKPIRTISKVSNQTFGIRKGVPLGCKVTLRGEKATDFLKKAFEGVDWVISPKNFDNHGNFSFGIREHIDMPGVKYNPQVGIFGMDIAVTIERPGYRIKRRQLRPKYVSKSHSIKKEEAIEFAKKDLKVKVEEE